jgi:hypothetical protein
LGWAPYQCKVGASDFAMITLRGSIWSHPVVKCLIETNQYADRPPPGRREGYPCLMVGHCDGWGLVGLQCIWAETDTSPLQALRARPHSRRSHWRRVATHNAGRGGCPSHIRLVRWYHRAVHQGPPQSCAVSRADENARHRDAHAPRRPTVRCSATSDPRPRILQPSTRQVPSNTDVLRTSRPTRTPRVDHSATTGLGSPQQYISPHPHGVDSAARPANGISTAQPTSHRSLPPSLRIKRPDHSIHPTSQKECCNRAIQTDHFHP